MISSAPGPHGGPGFYPPGVWPWPDAGVFVSRDRSPLGRALDRATFFVDGNNWYHSLRESGLADLGRLSYARVCEKLAGPRTWVATRYYIPHVGVMGNPRLLAEQRNFLARLRAQDSRISVHVGRLEARELESEAARHLLRYLAGLKVRIPARVFKELVALGKAHAKTHVFVEKAVDVQIAVDMLTLAENDEFDTAYLLSADGDFTPAVEAVRRRGQRVIAASPGPGAMLASVANAYIRLRRTWFADCLLPSQAPPIL